MIYCKLCGMRQRWYRDLTKHYEVKHPFGKMDALKEGDAPTKGFWWCTREPHSRNEKWSNLGNNLLLGCENQREIIDHIKSNLRKGFKVPYEFQEYGKIAVDEMFEDRERLNMRRKLKFPSDALMNEYHKLNLAIGDSDEISPNSAAEILTSQRK